MLPLHLLISPLLASGAALTEVEPPATQEPMTNEDALVIYCAGLDAMLVDPRDAGLLRALKMADERILELPAELNMADEIPAPMIQALLDMLGAPMSFRIDPIDDGDWANGPPFEAQLTVHGSASEIDTLASRVEYLMGMVGMPPGEPIEGMAGIKCLPTPAGEAFYGTPQSSDARFVASWGRPDLGPLGLGSLDLPPGVDPALAFKFDMGRLKPMMEQVFQMAGEDAAMLRMQLEMYGLMSDEPMQITAALGHGEGRMWSSMRYGNWKAMAELSGAYVAEPLTAADLAVIPADATMATVSKANLGSILTAMDQMIAMQGMEEEIDIRGMIKAFVGIDLQTDLFDHLGTTTGFYLSDTTGGGGLGSGVIFIQLTGAQPLGQTVDFLSGMINDLAQVEANGYVEVRTWPHGDTTCHSLTFPGLPIPIEPCLALTEGWLFVGATPQALAAAVDHAANGGPGLMNANGFQANLPAPLTNLTSITYGDTAATIGNGYGIASLMCTALANGVRSPHDPERDPGLILPPYRELVANARPSVMVTYIEGNDLVTLASGDSSVVAGITSFLGSSFGLLVIGGIGAGAMVGALAGRAGGF